MALIDTPLAGQTLATTRAPIQTNFLTVNTGFAVNHVELTAGDPNQGKHKYVTLTDQTAPGDPAVAAGELAVYNKALSLFMKNGTTSAVTALFGPSTLANNGSITINGLTVKWGRTVATNGVGVSPYSGAFSTSIFVVLATPVDFTDRRSVTISAYNLNNFTAYGYIGNVATINIPIHYVAIGV